jgi:hypothetical protein
MFGFNIDWICGWIALVGRLEALSKGGLQVEINLLQ